MTCIPIKNGVLCVAGEIHSVTVNGKEHPFEMHHYYGVIWLELNGDPLANQNKPKAVWDAWEKWKP